jgi:hypothetical protein
MSDMTTVGTTVSAPTTPAPASTSGQAAPQTGEPSAAPASEPYFSYKWEDGKVDEYKTRQDLERAYRSGYLRHQDYTKKTQEISAERKKYEAEQARLKEAFERVNGIETKWKPVDEFLRKRPDVAEYLLTQMKGPATRGNDEATAVKKEFDEFRAKYEDRVKQDEDERKRKAIFSSMKERYEDFDEDEIGVAITELLEAAPGDEMASLVDLLYWARKGRMMPEQVQAKITEGLKKKAAMKAPMTSGGQVTSGPRVYKTLQEAAEAAKAQYE